VEERYRQYLARHILVLSGAAQVFLGPGSRFYLTAQSRRPLPHLNLKRAVELLQPQPRLGAKAPAAAPRPGLSTSPVTQLALEDRKQGRRRRELRLLQYMLQSAEWCARVLRDMPPEEFADSGCAELAALIRDGRDAGESPDIDSLRRRCTGEHAAALIVDLAVPGHDLGFSEWELAKALARFEIERLQRELESINEQLRHESDASPQAAVLLARQGELSKRIASLR